MPGFHISSDPNAEIPERVKYMKQSFVVTPVDNPRTLIMSVYDGGNTMSKNAPTTMIETTVGDQTFTITERPPIADQAVLEQRLGEFASFVIAITTNNP